MNCLSIALFNFMNQEITKTDPDVLVDDELGLVDDTPSAEPQTSNQIYLFCGLHTLSLIVYLQHNSNQIYIVQKSSPDTISYKIQNDYAYNSIKLVFHSQTFSYYLYKCGLILFWMQLFSIVCLFIQERVIKAARLISQPYLMSSILTWFMVYASGQLFQLMMYNYVYEVDKLSAYQQNLEGGQGDKKPQVNKEEQKQIERDEGQITFYSWVILFAFCVILVSILKCLWILIGQLYYKRLLQPSSDRLFINNQAL